MFPISCFSVLHTIVSVFGCMQYSYQLQLCACSCHFIVTSLFAVLKWSQQIITCVSYVYFDFNVGKNTFLLTCNCSCNSPSATNQHMHHRQQQLRSNNISLSFSHKAMKERLLIYCAHPEARYSWTVFLQLLCSHVYGECTYASTFQTSGLD